MTEEDAIELKVDAMFIETGVNCLLGMMNEKKFTDVFTVLKTPPHINSASFTTGQAATATYHLLLTLFNGEHEFVKDVGTLLATAKGHEMEVIVTKHI